jgi:hypothetical protein
METMTHQPLTPTDWYTPHCAICIQTGKPTTATWIVNQGGGTRGLLACDKHRDILERDGIKALDRRSKKLDPA